MAQRAPDPVKGGHEVTETFKVTFDDGDTLVSRRVDEINAVQVTRAGDPGTNDPVGADLSPSASNEVKLYANGQTGVDAYVTVIGS